MLFANGYRYHMRSIGCPMSLDGYGLSNGYFGRYRHSIGTINNYDSYLNAPARRSGTPNCRRSRTRTRRRTDERIQGQPNSALNIFSVLRNALLASNAVVSTGGVSAPNTAYILPGVLPIVSRKCLISMTSALLLLLVLGIVSTIVGGVYFQRGNHPNNFKDNIHQLLCIVAIICGIIMLLSSGVLCRVLFCKGKWNYSSSPRRRVIVTSSRTNHQNGVTASNCNETILNMDNGEDIFQNCAFQSQLAEAALRDEPPTYSECNASISDLHTHLPESPLPHRDHLTQMNATVANNNSNTSRNESITPPPKYTNEPPPRYSQLDVRSLVVTIVPNDSSIQDDNVSFRANAQESPLPAIESISSPNNSLNEMDTENILVIEDYKPC